MKKTSPMSRTGSTPWLKCLAALALAPGLISCSGGGDDGGGPVPAPPGPPKDPVACSQYNTVVSGFSGDLNAEGPAPDPGGGGNGGFGGDAGSVGAGGGLGKVLGARVEVVRLADGVRFNGADVRTDPVHGLFTVKTCSTSEPLLITLKGVEGAQYFDEGKNALLPFGPDQELHALVDGVKGGNVGVSALTEAGYRYAINNYLGAQPKTVAGPNFLLKKAEVAEVMKLTKPQIAEANQVVLREFNRVLPINYRLEMLTALPTPVGLDNQSESLFPKNRYGQAAVVTGAFAWMADRFRLGSDRPALAILEQFSRDLTDGKLDGFALDGSSSSASSNPAYESANLPINLTVGANAVADNFSSVNLNAAYKYADVATFRETLSCDTNQFIVGLTKFGQLEVQKQRFVNCQPSGTQVRDEAFIAAAGGNIKEVLNSQYSGGGFFVKEDGRVFSWGNSECGQIANGASSGIQTMPVQIAGLKNITSLSSGYFFSVARDNDGHVYTWGSDEGGGALGLGDNPPLNATCESTTLLASSVPQRVPGLSNITTVHAAETRAFAVMQDGRLFNWGGACGRGGGGAAHSSPVQVQNLPVVRSVAANATGCFALKTDGTLVGWGFYNNITHGSTTYMDGQWFGDGSGTAKIDPTPLPGLTDVREIASDEYFFYALKADGTVWRWGRAPGMPELRTPTLVAGLPEAKPGEKTIIRHIKSERDGARFFAQDGRIFQAKAWADAPAYVIDLVDIYRFK